MLSELMYAGGFVLIIETIEGLRNNFMKWKETFVNMNLNVDLEITKVMVSGDIIKDG